MAQPYPYPSGSPATASAARAKKNVGTIVLLVLLSLSNAFTLVLGVLGWADEVEHGSDLDDPMLQAMVLVTFVSAIAVVALGGAWFTRLWGPRLYVGLSGVSLVLGLIVSGGEFSPLSLVGITLAVVLWLTAESSW